MGGLAEKRLIDLLPTVDAYRPVALAVAAILALAYVLPGATADHGRSSFSNAAVSDRPTAPEAEAAPTPPAASPSTTAPRAVTPPVAPRPTSPASPATSRPPATTPRDQVVIPPVGDDGTSGGDEAPDEPLRLTVTGWASATAGTPLSSSDVPEGTLPVGRRLGQRDKASYVRLAGDRSVLVLAEDAAGRRGDFDVVPVQACQIVDRGWEGTPDMAFDDAPAFDPDTCVAAARQADGTWTVDVRLFSSPTDDRGLALVPTDDAPIDFQITFAGQAVT